MMLTSKIGFLKKKSRCAVGFTVFLFVFDTIDLTFVCDWVSFIAVNLAVNKYKENTRDFYHEMLRFWLKVGRFWICCVGGDF